MIEALSNGPPEAAPAVEPTLAGAVWRFRGLVILILLASIAAAGWYVVAQSAQYTATATLFVQDPRVSALFSNGQNAEPPDRYVADQVALLKSKRISDRASQFSAHSQQPLGTDYFHDHTTIDSSSRDNNLIDIGFTTSDASTALAGLENVVSAYKAIRTDDAQAEAAPTLAALDSSVQGIDKQLSQITGLLATPAGKNDPALIQQQQRLIDQRAALTDQRQRLVITTTQQSAGVTQYAPAQAQASSRLRRGLPILALGIVGGAVIAAVVAYLLALRRPIITNAEAAEAILGAPLLAEIPPLGTRRGSTLPMLNGLDSRAASAFRFLAASIDLSQNDPAAACIAVVSSSRGEGRSTVCANLALALAGSDVRVVIVEPDMDRRGGSALMLAVGTAKPTQLETDAGRLRLEQMIFETGPPQRRRLELALLAPGGSTIAIERFGRLMQRESAPKVFGELARHFDVVLVDGPALCDASPTLRLLNHIQRVVLVVNSGSSVSTLREAARRTSLLGVTVVGYVFNHAPRRLPHPARLAPIRPAESKPAPRPVESPATPRA